MAKIGRALKKSQVECLFLGSEELEVERESFSFGLAFVRLLLNTFVKETKKIKRSLEFER